MIRLRPLHFVLSLVCFLPAPCRAVDPAGAPQSADVQFVARQLTYYFDLLLKTEYDFPTLAQDEATSAMSPLYAALDVLPAILPDAPEAIVAARTLWESSIRPHHPVVAVQYAQGHSRVAALYSHGRDTPGASLLFTRGLPRPLIIEVENTASTSLEFEVQVPGVAAPQRDWLAQHETRAFIFPLKFDQTLSQPLTIKVGLASEPTRADSLAVPIVLQEPVLLRGLALDTATSQPAPSRLWVAGSDGCLRRGLEFAANATVSEKQILIFPRRSAKPRQLPFFYTSGPYEVLLPPGSATVQIERGFECPIVSKSLKVAGPGPTTCDIATGRAVDTKAASWISGDTHVHWVKNYWSEDEDLSLLGVVQRAEDIRVINNLTLMSRTRNKTFISPAQFPMGPVPGYCDSEYHIQMAEEYRNDDLYGHLCLLNLKYLVTPISTGTGQGGPDNIDYPTNRNAILQTRIQGGISVEAHGLGPFHRSDVPVNAALRLSDSFDQLDPESYYRFLDCGFRIPLTNGSDHPARVAGVCRAYVKVDGPFTYERWIDGIRRGRTFTSSGPIIYLSVNGADIGEEVEVSKGQKLKITARAWSRHPVGNLQIVANGAVVGRSFGAAPGWTQLDLELPADEPMWICARSSPSDQYSALDQDNVSHTSPIFVKVNGKNRFSVGAAKWWLRLVEAHAANVKARGVFLTPAQREEALAHIAEGRQRYLELIETNGNPTSAVIGDTVTSGSPKRTTNPPGGALRP